MEEKWFNKSIKETTEKLNIDLEKGLNNEQVLERQKQYGKNK